ncbi:MAG: outer membrane beta-barrel protein [Vicinamibacterales bacterium]
MRDFHSSRSVLIRAAVAVVLVAAGVVHANAQSQPSEFGVGLKSGVQWPTSNAGSDQLGSNIGLFFDYNGKGHVSVIGDVLFVMLPQSDEPGAPSGRHHYFQLPVMLRLRQGNGFLGVYGIVGPAFNFRVSGSDDFQDRAVDLVYGGGVEIKNAMIEARLSRGSRDRVVAGATSSHTQQTFQLLAAFRLMP